MNRIDIPDAATRYQKHKRDSATRWWLVVISIALAWAGLAYALHAVEEAAAAAAADRARIRIEVAKVSPGIRDDKIILKAVDGSTIECDPTPGQTAPNTVRYVCRTVSR